MTSKKKLFSVVIIAALLITVFAMPNVGAQEEEEVFRVAVVSPSATNDLAFSQSMYDALVLFQEEAGAEAFEFVFQEGTFVVDDAAVALRDWASSGEYHLIIAHGSQYGAILEELAPEFPEISFAWGTDVNTFGLDNVFAYTAAAEQGGYVNGVLAAALSESGNIGVVGPIEVGDAKAYVDGFVAGAIAQNPDAEVNVTYIQSFSDVPLATEAAQAFISNGADVLTGTAQMVVGPIALALENELPWFGTQSSQAELAGASGVSFQVYHWEYVLAEIILNILDGKLGGESYVLTLENGGLVIEFSESFELTEEIQALADATIAGIVDGSIVLPGAEADADATPEPESTPE